MRRFLLSPIAFFLVFLSFAIAARFESERQQLVLEQLRNAEVEVFQTTLVRELGERLHHATGIVAYVAENPSLTEDAYIRYARRVLPADEGILRNIGLLRDTTILYQYPKEGNESSLGSDLAEVKGQSASVLSVKTQGQMALVGPVALVQGGRALIYRLPIHLDDGAYWGQLSVVIDYEALTKATGVIDLSEKYPLLLAADETFENLLYESPRASKENALILPLTVGPSQWYLALGDPYIPTRDIVTPLLLASGLLFGSLVAYGIYRLQHETDRLEKRVKDRTQQLEDTIDDLIKTQEQLILQEKLAALGDLVAGVAHEINTPLGIAVTMSSHLKELLLKINESHKAKDLQLSQFEAYLSDAQEGHDLLESNLTRAAELVTSFKMLSSDQRHKEKRLVDVGAYIEEILLSLRPKLKGTSIILDTSIEKGHQAWIDAGALSTILTNLFSNALIHGFSLGQAGRLTIRLVKEAGVLLLSVTDTGRGIPKDSLEKIFSPFYTTGRHKGSTGLGLHLVHNAVTNDLSGTIEVFSHPGETTFVIRFPQIEHPEA